MCKRCAAQAASTSSAAPPACPSGFARYEIRSANSCSLIPCSRPSGIREILLALLDSMSDFLDDLLLGGRVEEGDGLVVFAADDAGLDVAVLGLDEDLLVAVEDLGGGVDDGLDQLGAVVLDADAGEAGADLAAVVVAGLVAASAADGLGVVEDLVAVLGVAVVGQGEAAVGVAVGLLGGDGLRRVLPAVLDPGFDGELPAAGVVVAADDERCSCRP